MRTADIAPSMTMPDAIIEECIDIDDTAARLRNHLKALTVDIGERSIDRPENLKKTADYIQAFYQGIGLPVQLQSYLYRKLPVANIISEIGFAGRPSKRYLLGAHYDSLRGTVGADDNASAVAVHLEVARLFKSLQPNGSPGLALKLVSFTLEERPASATRYRGSRVYAREARRVGEKIDGMLCLEMVGYSRNGPKSQRYPFPLKYMDYPEEGNFIGIVGNLRSRRFAQSISRAFRANPNLPSVTLSVPLNGWLLPSVRRSDHAPFWDQGYQAVMITDTAFYRNPHYHRVSDTMGELDYRFMAELVKSLLLFFCSSTHES